MNEVKVVVGKKGSKGSKVLTVDTVNKTLKFGSEKRFKPIGAAFASVSKGEARKIRKALRANGYAGIAAISRAA